MVDKDEPQSGHRFLFTLAPDAASSRHFTLWDVKGKRSSKSLHYVLVVSLMCIFSVCVVCVCKVKVNQVFSQLIN